MKGVCAIYNNKALALVTRSGSHALMSLMLPNLYEQRIPSGSKEDRWHPIMNLQGHDLRNGLPEVEQICVMVRNPIERFISSMARRKLSFKQAIEAKDEDVHFWSIESMGLINKKCSYFLFPQEIDLCAESLGLKSPVPRLNEENYKPNLSNLEIETLEKFYQADIELYNNLKDKYHERV
jgi:hypothetical protein